MTSEPVSLSAVQLKDDDDDEVEAEQEAPPPRAADVSTLAAVSGGGGASAEGAPAEDVSQLLRRCARERVSRRRARDRFDFV